MPPNPIVYKIIKSGWYLLSGFKGESLNEIIQSYYPKYTYLDVSKAYVPLSTDIYNLSQVEIDNREIKLGEGPNGVTDINADKLVFNETIGEVASQNQPNPSLVGFIDDFNTPLSESTGIWVLIFNTGNDSSPTLYLSISNEVYRDCNTITNYNGHIDISFSSDTSINIVVERTFLFNTNMIHAYTNNDASLNITYNLPSSDIIDGLTTYSVYTSSTIFIPEQNIKYFIEDSIDNNNNFEVTVSFQVTDTIFPTLSFSESENEDSTISDLEYILSENNIRCTSNNQIYHIDISLAQSFVKQYVNVNLLPKVISYDQNDPQSQELIITKTSDNYMNGIVPNFEANVYNITYQSIDDYANTTTLSVSFEIFDDIPPLIVVTSYDVANNPKIYTNIVSNTDYKFEHSIDIDVDTPIGGSGYTFNEGLTDFSFSTDTEAIRTIDIYLKWFDLELVPWFFPIANYSDFSGVNLGSDTGTISIVNGSTYHFIQNVLESYADNSIYATQHFSRSDTKNNVSEISFNIHVFDDTIPRVDITYKRTSSHYSANYIVYPDEEILIDNLNQNPGNILGDKEDNISFEFSMNKDCSCKIIFSYNDHALKKTFVHSDFSKNHVINLGHNLVNNSGDYSIFFVISDVYGNYLSFRKDIQMTNNPSPELGDLFNDLSTNYYNLASSVSDFTAGKFTDLSGAFTDLSRAFTDLSNTFYTDMDNLIISINNVNNNPYVPKPYIARHPNVYVKNNYNAIEVGTVFESPSNEIILAVDLGSIELFNVEQYYNSENNLVDSSNDGYSRVLGEIDNDIVGGILIQSVINSRPNNEFTAEVGTTGLQYFEQSIPIPQDGIVNATPPPEYNTITDNSYSGFHFCNINVEFKIGPIPIDFAGNPFRGDKYTQYTFPYNRPEWNTGTSVGGQVATINFYVCPSHFNYQGTDISENVNNTSWYAPLTINDASDQPITAHHLLQYQPIGDNPETSYIYLNYTHSEETPHRFYISNTLYNYWTVTDYSKNLQIFSPNINEDAWIKENIGNWVWDDTIDISNTSSANKRYTINYRKIVCTDNAEIEAKKYRIGFI